MRLSTRAFRGIQPELHRAKHLLEINTQPGMTPLSLVPELARYAEIDFAQLVSWMVENAS